MSKHTISATKLSKRFKIRGNKNPLSGIWRPEWSYVDAAQDITFTIDQGERVAFLGPNGAGKTTTIKMLTGIIYPSEGEATILGHDPKKRERAYLSQIGLVMGNRAGLNWDLTARQNYWLFAELYGISHTQSETYITELAETLQVSHRLDTQVRRTSLGERMKLEIIGAILHKPKVLFLDEPTIGLDIEAKAAIRTFLRGLSDKGVTVLLTSHDMDDVEEVCDRVIVINKGRLVHDSTMQSLRDSYHTKQYIRAHFAQKVTPKTLEHLGVVLSQDHGTLLEVEREKVGEVLVSLVQNHQALDITTEGIPLEKMISDIFNARS